MKITIDARTGQISATEELGGVVGFFSWRRLAEILRESGEVKTGERLMSYRLDEHGIHYRVDRNS